MLHVTQVMRGRWTPHLLLTAFVVVTRLPLVGPYAGEPDSCRYLTGLYLWVTGDQGNHLIYAKAMSSGYYLLMASLVRISHANVQQYALITNYVSLVAALLMAPMVFELGRRITNDYVAFFSSLLFLASPAVWWMGIEPHPQVLSALLCMLALYACDRGLAGTYGSAWKAISILCMIGALLIKIDAVLLVPAFYGLVLVSRDRSTGRRACLWTVTAMLGTAIAIFVAVRPLILGVRMYQPQLETEQALSSFLLMPSGLSIVRQVMPVVMAVGPAISVFVFIGIVFLIRSVDSRELLRWGSLCGSWTLVGCSFWFFIAGNVPRHVVVFTLPLLWMGVAGWREYLGRHWRVFALVCVLVIIANIFSVPPNSSTSHLLSPNVPKSAIMLREREEEIREVARKAANQERACFVGTYTIPYLRFYLLEQTSFLNPSLRQEGRTSWVRTKRYLITCPDVQSSSSQRQVGNISSKGVADKARCPRIYSVEYRQDGKKMRYFGSEVYSSALWKRIIVMMSGSR